MPGGISASGLYRYAHRWCASDSLTYLQKRGRVDNDGFFTVAHGTIYETSDAKVLPAQKRAIQQGVVDPLLNPSSVGSSGLPEPPYFSSFNQASHGGQGGNSGYIAGVSDKALLLNNLQAAETCNFYVIAHGFPDRIFGGFEGWSGYWTLECTEVANALGNTVIEDTGGLHISRMHPYRVVIMDSCQTATYPDWASAFGISVIDQLNVPPIIHPIVGPINGVNDFNVQCFAGWYSIANGPLSDENWDDYHDTLGFIFGAWTERTESRVLPHSRSI